MPIKKLILVGALGLMIGAASWFLQSLPSQGGERDVASTKKNHGLKFGKLNKPMNLRIRDLQDISVVEPKEYKLRGFLTLTQPISEDIEYRWVLPKEAHVIAGEDSGTFRALPVGKEVSTDITIAFPEDADDNLIVAFEAFYVSSGTRIANSAVYNPAPKSAEPDSHETMKLQALPEKSEDKLPSNIQM